MKPNKYHKIIFPVCILVLILIGRVARRLFLRQFRELKVRLVLLVVNQVSKVNSARCLPALVAGLVQWECIVLLQQAHKASPIPLYLDAMI